MLRNPVHRNQIHDVLYYVNLCTGNAGVLVRVSLNKSVGQLPEQLGRLLNRGYSLREECMGYPGLISIVSAEICLRFSISQEWRNERESSPCLVVEAKYPPVAIRHTLETFGIRRFISYGVVTHISNAFDCVHNLRCLRGRGVFS